MDQVLLDNGEPVNPEGADWVDPGLGGFLLSLAEAGDPLVIPDHWRNSPFLTNVGKFTDEELRRLAAENYGKHKVPTLRGLHPQRRLQVPWPRW